MGGKAGLRGNGSEHDPSRHGWLRPAFHRDDPKTDRGANRRSHPRISGRTRSEPRCLPARLLPETAAAVAELNDNLNTIVFRSADNYYLAGGSSVAAGSMAGGSSLIVGATGSSMLGSSTSLTGSSVATADLVAGSAENLVDEYLAWLVS